MAAESTVTDHISQWGPSSGNKPNIGNETIWRAQHSVPPHFMSQVKTSLSCLRSTSWLLTCWELGMFFLTVVPFEISPQRSCLLQQLVRETLLPEHVQHIFLFKEFLTEIHLWVVFLSLNVISILLTGINAIIVYVSYLGYIIRH